MSDEQASLLLNTGRPIILLYDGSADARAGTRKAAGKLIAKAFVRVITLDDRVEPDHLTGEELFNLLSFAGVAMQPQ